MKSLMHKIVLGVVIAFFTTFNFPLKGSTVVVYDDFSQPNYDTGTHSPYNVYATRMWDGSPTGGGLSPNHGTTPGNTVLGANLPGGTWQFGGGYGSDYDVDEVGNLAAYGSSNIKLTGGTAVVPYATLHNYENVALSLGSYNASTQLTVSVDVCPQGSDCYVGFDSALNVSNNFSGVRVDQSGGVSLFVNGSQVGSTIAFTGTWSNATASLLTFTVNTSTGAISGITLQNSTSSYSFSTTAFTASTTAYFAFYTPAGSGSALFAYLQISSASGGTTYPLTVNSGTGSGSYNAGTVVSVIANTAPSGYQFAAWTGATSALANASAASTTLTMPAAATAITATYSPVNSGSTTVIYDDFSQPNYDTGTHSPYNVYATRMWDGSPSGGGLSPNKGTTPGNTVLGANLPGGTWLFGGGSNYDYDVDEVGNLSGYGASNIQLTGSSTFVPYATVHNNENVAISLAGYHTATTVTVSVYVLPQGGNAYVGFDSALNTANNFSGLMVDTSGGISLIVNGSQVGSTIAYTGTFSATTANLLTFSVNTSTGAISGISFQGSTSAYSFSTTAFTSSVTTYLAFFAPTGSSGHAIYAYLTVTSGSSGGGSAPTAPTGLTATAGDAQVALSWAASSGATSYNVYRGTTSGGESTTAIATGITSTAYTNTGLTNGTTYYYKVTATNSSGTSGYSNEASAAPSSGVSIPSAPTSLAASAGNTQVGLSWSASTGATSYNVYRGTTSGGESPTAIVTGLTSTSYTNTGLTNGTAYYYKVSATNSAGTSGYSNEATATPASSGGSYLPSTATAPTGVYSLTKLIATYSGPAINVVRSSDGASSDIGFVGQALDTTTANNFANGATLNVAKVYDQSGNGNTLTQTLAAAQPVLYQPQIAGIVSTPVIMVNYETTSNYFIYFNIPSTLTANRQNFSEFMAARFPTEARPSPIADFFTGASSDFNWWHLNSNFLQQVLTGPDTSITTLSSTQRSFSTASPCVAGVVSSSSGVTFMRDAFSYVAPAVSSASMPSGGQLMGSHLDVMFQSRFDMFSWIFYPAALSTTDATSVRKALQGIHTTNADTVTDNIWIQGDSITEGAGSGHNITIARALTDNIADTSKLVRCYGISGDDLGSEENFWLNRGNGYIEPSASQNILIVWMGINDLVAYNRSASTIWSELQTYVSNARTSGKWSKVIGVTVLPDGATGNTPATEAQRQSLNAMIRVGGNGNGLFDTIWDADALTNSGQPLYGYTTNTALSMDHLHPNESTYGIMGPYLKAVVATQY